MNKITLEGKRAVITGGSRGIGKAIAKAFLEHGAEVFLLARNNEELMAVQKECAELGTVHTRVLDVAEERSVEEAACEIEKVWGGVDMLVNAAGIYGPIGKVTDVDPQEWKKALEVNLFGTFLMTRAVVPMMKKQGGGTIVNFVGGGEGAYPHFTSYVSAKGGIARFTETVAAELKDSNIDVNAIAPGAVNTKFLEDILDAGPEKAGKENYERSLKQKESQGVPPEKAAQLVLFLASDAAKGLTGKILSAVWDPYEKFSEHMKDIMDSDVYTFRRVRPKDRGFTWDE